MARYYDVNSPWYISMQKGQTPSKMEWRKLSGKVDLKLLCIFMVADRIDYPEGWQRNNSLRWFLDEANDKQHTDNDALIYE